MKQIIIILFIILMNSYAYVAIPPQIKDIEHISQNFESYKPDSNISFVKYQQNFLVKYYEPWDKNLKLDIQSFENGTKYTATDKIYFGENKREISRQFKDIQTINENKSSFPSVSKNAITIRNTDCRHLPTNKPFFKLDGYPFDRLQNSMIHINTPIKVLHFSADKEYAFVQASYVSGWIKSNDLAYISEEDIKKIKSLNTVATTIDGISIIDKNDNFISKAYIGSIFWTDSQNVLFIAKADANSNAILIQTSMNPALQRLPIEFKKENIYKIAKELYAQNYGWGGYLENRDCSMLMRDFYVPFGVYLPRNSYDQISDISSEIISLENKTVQEKLEIIKKNAKPFATLVYMKGHIMMYIGMLDENPIIFHSSWGVKIKNKEKLIIGGSFITSLLPGIEIEDFDEKGGTLFDKITFLRTFNDNPLEVKSK
jgi:cell wall-associated NlpC family hydrolase